MGQFIVTTVARASISERWQVEGESPADIEARWDDEDIFALPASRFLDDKVDGDEEERQIVSIDPLTAPDPQIAIDEMALRLVSQDVRYCVSGLISTLWSKDWFPETGIDPDQLSSVSWRQPDADDYREALSYTDGAGHLTVSQGDGVWFYATTDSDGDSLDEGQGYDETEAGAWRAGYDSLRIDHPDGTECLEHWLVTDDLARRLREQGEAVADDIAGLTVWGRCTSGQAIYADAVIQRIARDILEA
jgi:hypothetical protein